MTYRPANGIDRCPICSNVMPQDRMNRHMSAHFLLLRGFEAMWQTNSTLALLNLLFILSNVFCITGCIAGIVRASV